MNTRQKVIKKLQSDLARFNVVDNTVSEKKVIAGQIPDVIIFQKNVQMENDPLFIIKIENGGDLVDSIQQWKSLGELPSSFYIVVPTSKIDEAKKLANITGVKARFASYDLDESENVKEIHYE